MFFPFKNQLSTNLNMGNFVGPAAAEVSAASLLHETEPTKTSFVHRA